MLRIALIGILAAAIAGPTIAQDWQQNPAYGTISLQSGFTPDPHSVNIQAGGSIQARNIGCAGHIANAPDYRLQWQAGNLGLPLVFHVSSNHDLTLVVNDPTGQWLCDDDSGEGLNPLVYINTPQSGQYDIWIGTFSPGPLQASTLHITEIDPRPQGGK